MTDISIKSIQNGWLFRNFDWSESTPKYFKTLDEVVNFMVKEFDVKVKQA